MLEDHSRHQPPSLQDSTTYVTGYCTLQFSLLSDKYPCRRSLLNAPAIVHISLHIFLCSLKSLPKSKSASGKLHGGLGPYIHHSYMCVTVVTQVGIMHPPSAAVPLSASRAGSPPRARASAAPLPCLGADHCWQQEHLYLWEIQDPPGWTRQTAQPEHSSQAYRNTLDTSGNQRWGEHVCKVAAGRSGSLMAARELVLNRTLVAMCKSMESHSSFMLLFSRCRHHAYFQYYLHCRYIPSKTHPNNHPSSPYAIQIPTFA